MDFVRVTVVAPSGLRRVMTVPRSVPVRELLEDLIGRMQLPQTSHSNVPICYRLENKRTETVLDEAKSIDSADVLQDDALVICVGSDSAENPSQTDNPTPTDK